MKWSHLSYFPQLKQWSENCTWHKEPLKQLTSTSTCRKLKIMGLELVLISDPLSSNAWSCFKEISDDKTNSETNACTKLVCMVVLKPLAPICQNTIASVTVVGVWKWEPNPKTQGRDN